MVKARPRYMREKELAVLMEYYGGLAKFCEASGIHPKTLQDWLRDGIPNRFIADCLTIAANDPEMFDLLLKRARKEEQCRLAGAR